MNICICIGKEMRGRTVSPTEPVELEVPDPKSPAEPTADVAAPVVAMCNFCQSTDFAAHMGRDGERCSQCGSLRRHRVALEVYKRRGIFDKDRTAPIRVLHLAPEYILVKELRTVAGGGYITADPNPSAYGSSQCLKLEFPDAFGVFPDDYFDYILHNHVLERIPGSYRKHLSDFSRIIKPWGYHIFSVPGPDLSILTEEGGEFLSSDEDRIEAFGQANHVRRFGRDLPEVLAELPNGQFTWDNLSTADRAAIGVPPRSNRFLVWRKGRGKGLSA